MNRKAFLLLAFTLTCLIGWARKSGELLQQLNRATTPQEKIRLYNSISDYYREVDPKQTVFYGFRAARVATLHQDQKGLADAYHNISIGYYWLKNMLRASEYTYKGLKIREQLNDSVGMASCYIAIGNIYRGQENFEKSLHYFRKALGMGRELGRLRTISTSLNNLGATYEIMGQPQKALAYYLQVRDINTEIGDAEDHALNNLNLGNVYLLLGQKEKALPVLSAALAASIELKNEINKICLYRILAQVHLQEKEYEKARVLAFNSLETAEKVPSPDGIRDAALVLNSIFLAQGNYRLAHKYLALHNAYKDSLLLRERQEAKAEIHASYELEKTESENQSLRLEQDLQQEKMRQKELLQFATGALLVLALVLSYVFLRGRNRAKKINEQLALYNKIILSKNEDIRIQKEELEKLNLQKNKLFSIIAHDLRSPLISLRSLLQLLSMGALPQEKLDRFVKELDTQQQNTLSLLDNLLVWAKIQMEGITLTPAPVQLHRLVEENIELLLPQAKKKGLVLLNHVEEEYWAMVDEETIKLVVRNLLTNSIKFCHAGDTIDVFAHALEEGQLVVTVRDGGIGISAENQLKLFGPNNFKERGTANENGNGLGLMLCKEFIERNGGHIWVESQESQGASFFFTVPASPPIYNFLQQRQEPDQVETVA